MISAAVLAAWGASKGIRRWMVYTAMALCIVVTVVVVYRGIRDGIARSISDAHERGYAMGKRDADAVCRSEYLKAVGRAQQAGMTAELEAFRSQAARNKNLNDQRATLEGIAREPRAPVPAGCPGADPRLVRAGEEGSARIGGLAGELQRLRGAADRSAASPAAGQ